APAAPEVPDAGEASASTSTAPRPGPARSARGHAAPVPRSGSPRPCGPPPARPTRLSSPDTAPAAGRPASTGTTRTGRPTAPETQLTKSPRAPDAIARAARTPGPR